MRAVNVIAVVASTVLGSCAGPPEVETIVAAVVKESPLGHCTAGEANAALQALETGAVHWPAFLGEIGHAGLGRWYPCQYRLWAEVSPVTELPWVFCEHDVFLAGSAAVWPYEAIPFCAESFEDCSDDADCPAGFPCVDTLAETGDILDGVVDTVTFGPSPGPLVEQRLIRTPTKNAHDPEWGNIAWFQSGFIVQRAPGTYRSVLTTHDLGVLVGEVTVDIQVVSHQEHAARVAAGTWHR